jgi:ribosomal protein S18 acetylase RimI-like enzyme
VRHVSTYYSDENFQREVFPKLQKSEDWFYVALEGNSVVGISELTHTRKGWELLRIYVLPRYMGKGIGKKLLQLGEKFLALRKVRRYHVFAIRKNRPAVKFYIRNGFTRDPAKDRKGEVCLEKRLHLSTRGHLHPSHDKYAVRS